MVHGFHVAPFPTRVIAFVGAASQAAIVGPNGSWSSLHRGAADSRAARTRDENDPQAPPEEFLREEVN